MKKNIFAILALSLFIAGCSAAVDNGVKTGEDKTVCTQEAKVCPDGSSVGRTAPNCEFAPCPDDAAKSPGTGMANPASTFCVEHGGRSNIATDPDGSQRGECVLPDGKICDEWKYFRGTCGSDTSEQAEKN
jgi:hypothetical protein